MYESRSRAGSIGDLLDHVDDRQPIYSTMEVDNVNEKYGSQMSSINDSNLMVHEDETTIINSEVSKDVIAYMKMLINEETKPGEFVYAIIEDDYNPYELLPVPYSMI